MIVGLIPQCLVVPTLSLAGLKHEEEGGFRNCYRVDLCISCPRDRIPRLLNGSGVFYSL